MAKKRRQLIQTRLGEREIDLDSVVFFPRGLIGFDHFRRFVLLPVREDSPMLVLQSLEDPKVGLVVADPYAYMKEYEIKLGQAEKKLLRIANIRQLAVLVTVSIPPGRPQDMQLNLAGPIVINKDERLGLQVPQIDGDFPPRFRPAAKQS
ncbi:MAG: flagellar assembly factor FliW [Desulfovibrionales bacterium]|jgi:flagellar assembly factor FliW|nr:flagellar assembly factor FliW [Desulfovibrionales bacterium]